MRLLNILRYKIPQFLKNIWRFRVVLWEYRPWDWYGLYQAMYVSLKGMEEQQSKYGHSVNSDKYAKDIRICLKLLERLLADDYLSKDFDYSFMNGASISEWLKVDPIPHCSEQPSYKHGMKLRIKQQQAERELLFKLMAKHSQNWWD